MPISRDEFRTIDEGEDGRPDLSPDTTQGTIYRFLLKNADRAFRQREIVGAVDVPKGSVGPTLARLEAHGVVDHRGEYWSVADADHAVASAGALGAASADDRDGGFSDEEVAAWSETAVDPPESGDGRER
ncbi:MarR family transcriptional regulator [Halosimplex aquaticum]|uniref:MarR family transcriptional regulator n=1 Tax=Halosimplex aquaticum TaxID=3026162 RepID=A0ABD5Y4P7_9EURY|nr:MarR family transcriptional regulator [Halosimplex aquaticum]